MSLISNYDPVWNALKQAPKQGNTKAVKITANRLLHSRIVKAVTKRKWLDLGYKISTEPYKTILTHSREGSILTFYLTFYLTDMINVKDL